MSSNDEQRFSSLEQRLATLEREMKSLSRDQVEIEAECKALKTIVRDVRDRLSQPVRVQA